MSQLWFMSILFAYTVANKLTPSSKSEKSKAERENVYILNKYNKFNTLYQNHISMLTKDLSIKILIMAIMIVEDFNRPPIARVLERLAPHYISKTTGIMQVRSKERLSDEKSVQIASEFIVNQYETELNNIIAKGRARAGIKYEGPAKWEDRMALMSVVKRYNNCDDYQAMVMNIYDKLTAVIDPNSKRTIC